MARKWDTTQVELRDGGYVAVTTRFGSTKWSVVLWDRGLVVARSISFNTRGEAEQWAEAQIGHEKRLHAPAKEA